MEASFEYMINGETLGFSAELRQGPDLNYLCMDRLRGHPFNFNNEFKEIIKLFEKI